MEWSGQPFFKLFSNCHMLSGYSSITSFSTPAAGFAVSRVFQHFLPVSEGIQSARVYFCAWRWNTITFISEWMNRKVSHCVCRQRFMFERARPSRSAPPVPPCLRMLRGWGDLFAQWCSGRIVRCNSLLLLTWLWYFKDQQTLKEPWAKQGGFNLTNKEITWSTDI